MPNLTKKEILDWIRQDYEASGLDRRQYSLAEVAANVGCDPEDVRNVIPVYSGVGFWYPFDKRPTN